MNEGQPEAAVRHKFADYFYNPVTLAGMILSVLVLVVEAVLWATEMFLGVESPYFGLVLYLILPPFFGLGILLIPAGAWWTRRRLRRSPGTAVTKHIHIDFANPVHRNTAFAFILGGMVILVMSAAGIYQTYHFTESSTFCGEVCHKVMEPQFTVYKTSPHASINCASCHIGAGASYFAKSKITGSYQIYAVLTDNYPKPIPAPIKNLRPAQETCEQCHWPQHFYSPKERTSPHFLSDEKNTPVPVRLMVNVGGGRVGKGQTGIHLHMNINHVIEYIPYDDTREAIAWVRATDRITGEISEYRSKSLTISDSELFARPARRVDCIDCHNRPSHKFLSPQKIVNEALEAGTLDRTLPYIKREAVRALDKSYASRSEAMAGIAAALHDFYSEQYPAIEQTNPRRITDAILAVQDMHNKSQFPEMRVRWKAYPDHIGHLESPGCFRCHTDDMVSTKGKTMTRDCKTCHTFLKPETSGGWQARSYIEAPGFEHPGDVGDMWKETACHECHQGGAELY